MALSNSTLEMYATLEVECPNKELGCTWRCALKDVEEHVKTCERDLLKKAVAKIHVHEAEMFRRDKKIAFIQNDYAVKVNNHYKTKFENEVKGFKELKFQVGILMTEMGKVKDENEMLKQKYQELDAEVKQLKEDKTKGNVASSTSDLVSNESTLSRSVSDNPSSLSVSTIPSSITTNNEKPYLDVTIGGVNAGRLVINLFTTDAPKTCSKFIKLCTGEKGISYKDISFHLVHETLGRVGKDLTGSSGKPFPQDLKTPKENPLAEHSKRGLVTMRVMDGKATEGEIVFLFKKNRNCDGGHVIFGEVTEDSSTVLKKIEEVPRYRFAPKKEIKITSCGVLGL